MGEYLTQSESIREIANAIREANGETGALVYPGDFTSKIRELKKTKGMVKFVVPNFVEEHSYITLGVVEGLDAQRVANSLFCYYINIPNKVSNTVRVYARENAQLGPAGGFLQNTTRFTNSGEIADNSFYYSITSTTELTSGSGRVHLTEDNKLQVGSNTTAYPFQPGVIICWLIWHEWDEEADDTSVDWKVGYALDETGSEYSDDGFTVTNFIPCKKGDYVYIQGKGLDLSNGRVAEYTADGGASYVETGAAWLAVAVQDTHSFMRKFVDGYYCFAVKDEGTAMIRISFNDLASGEKMHIGVNDPVIFSGS